MIKIPFCKAHVGYEEKKAVLDILDSGWLTAGSVTKKFEEEFADYVGTKYAVATNSCTSALFLCLKCLGISCSDCVAVPSLTFTASASVIKHIGARICFVDVKEDSFCLNEKSVPRTGIDCVIAVHLLGNKCFTGFRCNVIEDSAHRIERNSASNNLTCYSFYATKNMTTGEGGMITTNSQSQYEWLLKARLHGLSKDAWKRNSGDESWRYEVEFAGYKCNPTDISSAIGRVQLKKLDWMNEQRQRIVDIYNQRLEMNRTGLHLYPLFIGYRSTFISFMAEAGIACSVHFLPLHLQPAYKEIENNPLPVTEKLGRGLVSLPLYPGLSDQDAHYICDQIERYYEDSHNRTSRVYRKAPVQSLA